MTIKNTLFTCCPRRLQPYWNRVEASELGCRLARGAFWSLAGAVISRGLMLVASMLLAQVFGKEVYGEFGMIRSTVGMFGVLAGFGLGLTATKHVADFRQSDPARAGRIIALSSLIAMVAGGLMALALFILAPWLARHTLNASHLSGLLRVGCLLLFLDAINGAQTGALAGFEAFKTIARVNLLAGLASFPMLVGGAYFGGLAGAVWGLVLSLAIRWALNHRALRREATRANVPMCVAGWTREWNVFWKFGLPLLLGSLAVGPANWACRAMLVNQPDGYGELGIFNAAFQWRIAVVFIPVTACQIVLPVLSSLVSVGNHSQYLKTLKYCVLLNVAAAVVVAIPILLMSGWIMACYGKDFAAGTWVLVLLVCSAGLKSLSVLLNQALISRGMAWLDFGCQAAWAAAISITMFCLTRSYCSAFHFALVYLAADVLLVCLYLACGARKLGAQLPERPLAQQPA